MGLCSHPGIPPGIPVPAQADSKGARCCQDAALTEPRSSHKAAPSAHPYLTMLGSPGSRSPCTGTAMPGSASGTAAHRGCLLRTACPIALAWGSALTVPEHRRVHAASPTARIPVSTARPGGEGGEQGTGAVPVLMDMPGVVRSLSPRAWRAPCQLGTLTPAVYFCLCRALTLKSGLVPQEGPPGLAQRLAAGCQGGGIGWAGVAPVRAGVCTPRRVGDVCCAAGCPSLAPHLVLYHMLLGASCDGKDPWGR